MQELCSEAESDDNISHMLFQILLNICKYEYDEVSVFLCSVFQVTLLKERTRKSKIQKYLYRRVASSSISEYLHCLALMLANEMP